MIKKALIFLFLFLPLSFSYSLYPGECMKFATEVKTYNFCIPHTAEANQTFTFKYEYMVHKTEGGGGGVRYVYFENKTKINELNKTLQEINETLNRASTNYKFLYEHYYKLFNNLLKKYNKLLEEKNNIEQSETCITTNMTPLNTNNITQEDVVKIKRMIYFLILTFIIIIFVYLVRIIVFR